MQRENELRLAAINPKTGFLIACQTVVGRKRNGKPRRCLGIWRQVSMREGKVVKVACDSCHKVIRPGTKAAKLA